MKSKPFEIHSSDPVEVVKILFPFVTERTGVKQLRGIRALLVYTRRMIDVLITAKGGEPEVKQAQRENPLTRGFDRIIRERAKRGTPGGKIGAAVPTA